MNTDVIMQFQYYDNASSAHTEKKMMAKQVKQAKHRDKPTKRQCRQVRRIDEKNIGK